jgi:CMP-N-acetylneuraminic acid synthetase
VLTSDLDQAPRFTALLPMRHHSERIEGKNYRPFCGRPLFHWVLEVLLAFPLVDEVIIDTDSRIIREQSSSLYPSVRLIDRPQWLLGDDVSMNDILVHDVGLTDAEVFLQTHSTNPLLRVETVTAACESFLGSLPTNDSMFSVTKRQVRLWDADHRPLNHDPGVLLRTQDLPPVYEENSCLFLFTRACIESCRNRIGRRPALFEMDTLEAWDIDHEVDFQIGESVFEVVRLGRSR